MRRVTINRLSFVYQELVILYKETEDSEVQEYISAVIDNLACHFWNLKKIQKAYRKYISDLYSWEGTKSNPTAFDYRYDKAFGASTCANLEGEFMDKVLMGRLDV